MMRWVSVVFVVVCALFALKAEAAGLVDNGDGTVTDNKTGLMWQQRDDGNKYKWNKAIKYCSSLNLGGKSDWRLPSQSELVTIFNGSIPWRDPGLKINKVFYCTREPYATWYWSSTTYDEGDTWYLDFRYGQNGPTPNDQFFYVRCVRDNGRRSDVHVDNVSYLPIMNEVMLRKFGATE